MGLKKITLLTDGIYPYVIGGMQRHSFYLAKYFAKNNVQVDLYHFNQSGYDISKLDFFSHEEKKYINSFVLEFPSLGKMPGHYIRESYEYSCRIFNVFRKNSDVDFIYAKGFCGWKLLEEKKKGFPCPPVGVNFHGYEMFQKARGLKSKIQGEFFLKKPVLYNIQNANYVFSYGGKITDLLLKLEVPANKIIESPAGIESNWLTKITASSSEIRKFIFVGRYERRKGIEELIRALRKLIPDYEFEFHFVGDIPSSKKILSNKIIYHGSISDSEKLKNILWGCDILVCPSHSEGMPNVILEAMASGLAVIAADVGAVNLLVNADTGWLLNSCTSSDIYDLLVKAMKIDNVSLLKMKQNAILHIKKNFLWDNLIKMLLEIFQRNILRTTSRPLT